MKTSELSDFADIFDNGEKWFSELFEPIPLTEEWLLKLGFKASFDWYERGKVAINFKEERMTEVVSCMWNQFKIPKYVHQLQNLYFALTEEELILKT